MAEAKETKEVKPSPLSNFRAKLSNKEALSATLQEGLVSTNAKVRAMASKVAYKTQNHEFVKKHVLPLMKKEKTKRVIQVISEQVTRKELFKKLSDFAKNKAAAIKSKADAPKAGAGK